MFCKTEYIMNLMEINILVMDTIIEAKFIQGIKLDINE